MNHQERVRDHQRAHPPIELRVVITNGQPAHDTRLKFEFSPSGYARVWLVRLPTIKNPDVFPRQLCSDAWELRLDVFAAPQPIAIMNYTPESVAEWLDDVFNDKKPSTTELLILANDGKFTISIHQPA